MTESEAGGIGLLINQLAQQERELIAARAEAERLNEVLEERFEAMEAAHERLSQAVAEKLAARAEAQELRESLSRWDTHLWRCLFRDGGECNCGFDAAQGLLQRIDAALGEKR